MAVDTRVRVAVIGAGFWSIKNHIPVLAERDDVELVSVCRLGPAHLAAIKREYGFRVATEDYEEALDAGVDAAVIAGPNTLHHAHAMAALERGLHILVEKPLALTAHDAWGIAGEAEKRGVHALVPHGWHYQPFVRRAYELVSAGRVGEIRHIVCQMATAYRGLFDGNTGYGTIELGGERFEASPETWAGSGGGYARGQMTHSLALLCWLTGLRARTVSGHSSASETGVDIVDTCMVEFDGGALASVSGCGIVPGGSKNQLDLRIFGDEGMLLLDVERERCVLRREDGANEEVEVEPGAGQYNCRAAVNRFIDLIAGKDDRNDSPLEVAARATEIVEALLASSQDGGVPVRIDTKVAA